jgi:hypothetical protein
MVTAFQAVVLITAFSIACLAVGIAVGRKLRSLAVMADPDHNPSLDKSEAAVRQAFQDEADALAAEWRRIDEERER